LPRKCEALDTIPSNTKKKKAKNKKIKLARHMTKINKIAKSTILVIKGFFVQFVIQGYSFLMTIKCQYEAGAHNFSYNM
jgi:hypothetical protein